MRFLDHENRGKMCGFQRGIFYQIFGDIFFPSNIPKKILFKEIDFKEEIDDISRFTITLFHIKSFFDSRHTKVSI